MFHVEPATDSNPRLGFRYDIEESEPGMKSNSAVTELAVTY